MLVNQLWLDLGMGAYVPLQQVACILPADHASARYARKMTRAAARRGPGNLWIKTDFSRIARSFILLNNGDIVDSVKTPEQLVGIGPRRVDPEVIEPNVPPT